MATVTYANSFNARVDDLARGYGGLLSNPNSLERTHNDQIDAYRHSLMSAELTQQLGAELAKYFMDKYERDHPNPLNEANMDLWNNNVGREEYDKWKSAVDAGLTTDPLTKWIYDRVKQGRTINDLNDSRQWIEPAPAVWNDTTPWNAVTGISADANASWRIATTPPRRDPLAIDLDGDGIETVGIPSSGSPILYDHDADGVRTGTGWLKGDDAWLVLDRNGNGAIDSGRELFGVDTLVTVTETVPGSHEASTITRNARSGFEALQSLDTGSGTAGSAGFGDGVFDGRDAAFSQVRLWQDLNQHGISQANELFTLADKGITSIGLVPSTLATSLGNGNTVTGQATVTRSNGSTTQIDSVDLQASNLNLADNPFYRQFSTSIVLTSQASALPEMGGSGWLRTMRDVMTLAIRLTTSALPKLGRAASCVLRTEFP